MATKEQVRETTDVEKKAVDEEHHTWIDQVLVNDANGDYFPINIEDIAQVVEVDEEGTHRTFLKESSLDPLLGTSSEFLTNFQPRIMNSAQKVVSFSQNRGLQGFKFMLSVYVSNDV